MTGSPVSGHTGSAIGEGTRKIPKMTQVGCLLRRPHGRAAHTAEWALVGRLVGSWPHLEASPRFWGVPWPATPTPRCGVNRAPSGPHKAHGGESRPSDDHQSRAPRSDFLSDFFFFFSVFRMPANPVCSSVRQVDDSRNPVFPCTR